jgi:hypothetical protein
MKKNNILLILYVTIIRRIIGIGKLDIDNQIINAYTKIEPNLNNQVQISIPIEKTLNKLIEKQVKQLNTNMHSKSAIMLLLNNVLYPKEYQKMRLIQIAETDINTFIENQITDINQIFYNINRNLSTSCKSVFMTQITVPEKIKKQANKILILTKPDFEYTAIKRRSEEINFNYTNNDNELELINMSEYLCAYPIGSMQLYYDVNKKSFELIYSDVRIKMLNKKFKMFSNSLSHLKELGKESRDSNLLSEMDEFNLETDNGRQMKDLEEKVQLFRILLGKIGAFVYKSTNYQNNGLDLNQVFSEIKREQNEIIEFVDKLNTNLAITKDGLKKHMELEKEIYEISIIDLTTQIHRIKINTAINKELVTANINYVLEPLTTGLIITSKITLETVTTIVNIGVNYTIDILYTTSHHVRKLGKDIILDTSLYGGGSIVLLFVLYYIYKKISFMKISKETS